MILAEYDEELTKKQWKEYYKEEGLKVGREQGVQQLLLDFLKEKGELPEELVIVIEQQDDIHILKQWVKIAAKTDSIEEYQKQTGQHFPG